MRLLGGTRLSSLVLCLVLASLSLEADAQARRQLIDRDPGEEFTMIRRRNHYIYEYIHILDF